MKIQPPSKPIVLPILIAIATCSAVQGAPPPECQDVDGDGYYAQASCGTPRDCNDASSAIRPGAPETCDGYDNDCDGALDDDAACDATCDIPDKAGDPLPVTAGADYEDQEIVWTGSEYAMAWHDDRIGGGTDIYFARIDAAGNKLGSDVRVTTERGYAFNPAMVFTGSEYGVTWDDARDGHWEIFFARLDVHGSRLGPDVQVTRDRFGSDSSSLAWTGSEYGVAWADTRDGDSEVYFARLDAAGDKLGQDVRLTSAPGFSSRPSLVWAGEEYGVAWADLRDGSWEIYFTRLDAAGNEIGDDVRVTVEAPAGLAPDLVWTGSEYGVAWYAVGEIYFARLDAAGNPVGPNVRVTSASGASVDPAMVWTGSEYGLSWSDGRHGLYEIYFARLDALGHKLGSDMRVSYDAPYSLDPSLVWTGREYGLSWIQNDVEIDFVRIGCDCVDADLDGSTVCSDCDDDTPTVFPGAPEICDGLNNDCRHPQWPVDLDDADVDLDGFSLCGGDCDDTRGAVFPGAEQICDGINNDCDNPAWPLTPPAEHDGDGDQFWECQGDCDDTDPAIGPQALDLCNQIDDDCNGLVDEDANGEDTDLDRVHNQCDNCRYDPNPGQTDLDADAQGDACDLDDGVIYILFHQKGYAEWDEESGFSSWNSYRGDLAVLQRDGVVAYAQDPARVPLAARHCDLAEPLVADADPPPDTAVFFLTTGNDTATGIESSLGVDSSGTERLNRFPCP